MSDLKEKISRFGILCKKGHYKGLTQEENREFKKLEKEITNIMLNNEKLFDDHIKSFRKAISPLIKVGFDYLFNLSFKQKEAK